LKKMANNNLKFEAIEINLLELKYEHSRIRDVNAVLRLAEAIEHEGQLVPVLTVQGQKPNHILIDGYLRVAALKRLGRDTVNAWVWQDKESEALIYSLARAQGRNWDFYEQACLVKHLHDDHKMDQSRIARLTGKDKSWVSRCLSVLESLPEKIVDLVREGHISCWSAQRILTPLARANIDHAVTLADHLKKKCIPTRSLSLFFNHYKKASRKVRGNMIENPRLFLKTLQASEEQKLSKQIESGPEGRWVKDMRIVASILSRLAKQVPLLFDRGQSNLDRRFLMTAFNETKELINEIERSIGKIDA